MDLIKNLEWRYATKKFDSNKKVSKENVDLLKRSIQLSASSYGLQLYKVLFIEDEALKKKLKTVSWDQPQITDSSHLLVFCHYDDVDEKDVDEFIELKANTQGKDIEDLKQFRDSIVSTVESRSKEELQHWTAKQTYIALGHLLIAAAELKIDACPMEGFKPDEYNKILGLTEKGLSAAVIATIGYRSGEDEVQHLEKVRKSKDTLFEDL